MKRFGIRNYGPTRQLPYKDQQIFLVNDGYITTDDEEMAAALGKEDRIYVTDSGVQYVPVPLETPEAVDTAVESPDDIAYNDMTVPELTLLAKDRQLDVKGLKKAEIIEVLQAYDSTPDLPDEPEEKDVSEKPEKPESEDAVKPETTEPEPEKKSPKKKSPKKKKSKKATQPKKDKGE